MNERPRHQSSLDGDIIWSSSVLPDGATEKIIVTPGEGGFSRIRVDRITPGIISTGATLTESRYLTKETIWAMNRGDENVPKKFERGAEVIASFPQKGFTLSLILFKIGENKFRRNINVQLNPDLGGLKSLTGLYKGSDELTWLNVFFNDGKIGDFTISPHRRLTQIDYNIGNQVGYATPSQKVQMGREFALYDKYHAQLNYPGSGVTDRKLTFSIWEEAETRSPMGRVAVWLPTSIDDVKIRNTMHNNWEHVQALVPAMVTYPK